MAEVSFAKTFLAALDARPFKLSPDHVEDPRRFPERTAYTLPRQTKPMRRPERGTNASSADQSQSTPTTKAAPGQERSFTVVIRSLRGGDPLRLTSQPPDAAVLDLRRAAAPLLPGSPSPDRLRLLFRKKPVPDHRVLRELAGDPDEQETPSEENRTGTVEFSLMLMGGGGGGGSGASSSTPKQQQQSAEASASAAAAADKKQQTEDVLQTPAFWEDLRGFLLQRTRDEGLAGEMAGEFRAAWEAKRNRT